MKSFKFALLGATLLVGVGAATTASAADMYARSMKDAPGEYMPAITWTGFYFGVHAGAAFFDEKGHGHGKKDHCYYPEPLEVLSMRALLDSESMGRKECDQERVLKQVEDHDNDSDGLDDTSWVAGLHLGYNWQRPNNVLFGIEGDVSFADEIDYLASLRGRLGYVMGPTLFYVTGGVAFIGLDDKFSDDDSSTGWVAGLGVEHKLRENVSIGLEGLYYSFDDLDSFKDDLEFWTVRARLTYHFTDLRDEPLK